MREMGKKEPPKAVGALEKEIGGEKVSEKWPCGEGAEQGRTTNQVPRPTGENKRQPQRKVGEPRVGGSLSPDVSETRSPKGM